MLDKREEVWVRAVVASLNELRPFDIANEVLAEFDKRFPAVQAAQDKSCVGCVNIVAGNRNWRNCGDCGRLHIDRYKRRESVFERNGTGVNQLR